MDPVADMFSLINNAIAVSKQQVVIFPYSDFKFSILELFKKQGLVEGVEKKGRLSNKRIILTLKYDEKGRPVFSKIKIVSKQGQRIYKQAKNIKRVKSGHGLAVISSSQGLMTDAEARKKKVGGELICEIW
ncbi:MAG TPA: 30S ribosomal protein S8 [Candidatus Pacearchaeota archaeon]|nr:30S ribosomal protein S8 [Candidatus Pacearchaeota archaeon]